jgi:uncharacterized protein (TIGR03435 family)
MLVDFSGCCAYLNFDGCSIFCIFFGTIPKRWASKQIMATKTKTLMVGIASILLALPVVAQTFEVVSIKPNTSGASETTLRPDPSGLVAVNTTTKMLLRVAFDDKSVYGALPDFRVVGGPDWLATDRFDIQAQPERPIRPEDLSSAVLAMLQDRFRLKAHHEQRQLPVYELTLANGQSKMKAVDAPPPGVEEAAGPPPRPGPDGLLPANFKPSAGHVFVSSGAIIGSAVPVTQLVYVLSQSLDSPVIDKTNLKGLFDFRLEFAPVRLSAPSDDPRPSVFAAIQEQLGLRLVSTRGPVDVVVVDSIRKPSEN